MKKLLYLFIAVSLVLALVPAAGFAHTEADPLVVDLLAGQTDDIGDVEVWNDADALYVNFVYDGPDCGFLEVHLQVDEGDWSGDILTKKGNPIPGQFEESYKPGGCFEEHTFSFDLSDEGFEVGDSLMIATHAALGRVDTMTFESNAGDTVYGPIYSDNVPTDWASAGSAVRAHNWLGYTRNLSDPDQIPGCTPNPLSSLTWSWGFGLNPTYTPDIPGVLWISTAPNTEQWHVDSWRKFVESYNVPGYPIEGSLQVNADNYYVVSNGETIGSDDNIFDGPETYAFYPMEGLNTLEFATENWAQGSSTNYCDQLRNPNGVTYKGTVSYYADGETAWGCRNDSADPNCIDFPGKNWATYFTYAVQEPCLNPPTGLVGWWPGDGNADDIAGTNNGTVNGSVPFVSGKVDQAFSFDGNAADYVRVPNDSTLEPAHVTVDAWVRANGSPGSARYIVAKGAQGCTAASYALYTGGGGGLYFYVYNPSYGYKLSPNAGSGIWDGNWHHVAGTYDGASVRLYVDGDQVGTGTPTSISIGYGLGTDNDLLIGQYRGSCTLPFKGDIDEVEVFSRALTQAEIQDIVDVDSCGKCKP